MWKGEEAVKKNDLPTPAVVVDLDILERNIHTMADRAREAGVKLRPHVKTHKTPAVARMQIEAGAGGITCAKASEAGVMARAGLRDILIAYPVVGEKQLGMIMEISEYCSVTAAFDSFFGAERINGAAGARGITIPLYMIVNTGLDRDGVGPGEEAVDLAGRVRDLKNVRIKGVMTHEGHVYQSENQAQVGKTAAEAGRRLVEIAGLLRGSGFPVEEVSMGSTPACRAGIVVDGITEWRPGTYVYNDASQLSLVTPIEECALSVLATVVSHPAPGRFILDAGSKTLAGDKLVAKGYGYIKNAPLAVIERLSEEHGVVGAERDGQLKIGQRVEIIPNHVCTVINLLDSVYVCRGEEVLDQWQVEARGKSV